MAFQVEELSLELIEALAPLMPRIKQRDKDAGGSVAARGEQHWAQLCGGGVFRSGKSASAAVYGGGKRGGDAACVAPSGRVAQRHGRRGGTRAGAASAHHRDSLADDARVVAKAPGSFRGLHRRPQRRLGFSSFVSRELADVGALRDGLPTLTGDVAHLEQVRSAGCDPQYRQLENRRDLSSPRASGAGQKLTPPAAAPEEARQCYRGDGEQGLFSAVGTGERASAASVVGRSCISGFIACASV